jgi:hypothetical protein
MAGCSITVPLDRLGSFGGLTVLSISTEATMVVSTCSALLSHFTAGVPLRGVFVSPVFTLLSLVLRAIMALHALPNASASSSKFSSDSWVDKGTDAGKFAGAEGSAAGSGTGTGNGSAHS